MCHLQILKPQQAVADLKKVVALEPKNAEVKKQLESTQKLLRKIEFEKVRTNIISCNSHLRSAIRDIIVVWATGSPIVARKK